MKGGNLHLHPLPAAGAQAEEAVKVNPVKARKIAPLMVNPNPLGSLATSGKESFCWQRRIASPFLSICRIGDGDGSFGSGSIGKEGGADKR